MLQLECYSTSELKVPYWLISGKIFHNVDSFPELGEHSASPDTDVPAGKQKVREEDETFGFLLE